MTRRILVVDDIATNRIVLKVKLASACYEVMQAADGESALRMARGSLPDLVLLDMMLPDLSGTEVCRRLKADPRTCDIPVVMITALRDAPARHEALRAGADDFLSKPLYEAMLLARIRSLLRARDTARELRLREDTSQALSLAEAATPFAPACAETDARVALVAHREEQARQWHASLAPHLPARYLILPQDMALSDRAAKVDLFVIAADLTRKGDGLRLMSELRSRPESRHAAYCVVLSRDPGEVGAMALDLGASDLLLEDAEPQETALRLAAQIRRKRQGDRLRISLRDGLELAVIDPLTGLYNRRYALPHLARITAAALAGGRQCAVLALDLDDFKSVNDSHGHAAGDAVLAEVAHRLRAEMRGHDLIARIGGDEFLAVMPDTTEAQARAAAERLCRHVSRLPVMLPDGRGTVRVTLSAGLAMSGGAGAAPPSGAGPEEIAAAILDRADRALLVAKAQGRDRVSLASGPAPATRRIA